MEKETKNLMDKLKDFEEGLKSTLKEREESVNFLLGKGIACLPEKMALGVIDKAVKALYSYFPDIKTYKK